MRNVIASAISDLITQRRYTCWACAVLSNHMHLCIRRHRDNDEVMWMEFAGTTARAIRQIPGIPADHRIWADRPFAIFLETPDDIRRVIAYIEQNPAKENLPPQKWPFVMPYNNWPFHKRGK